MRISGSFDAPLSPPLMRISGSFDALLSPPLMRISGGFDAPLSEKIPELFVKIPDIFLFPL